MTLTQEQLNKLIDLLCSKDQDFVQQGMILTETLIYDESDFFGLFKDLTTQPVPQTPSFQTIQQTFQRAQIDGIAIFERATQNLLSCWCLGMLAQWNTAIILETTTVDLSDSQLHTLPSILQRLTQLQSLDLHRNHLQHLPTWLGDLADLRELNVSKNPLRSLPNNLRTIRIDQDQWTNLQTELWSLHSLRHLNLQDCVIKHLPWTIQNLTELRTLLVAHNTPPPRREHLSTVQLLQLQKEALQKCAYLPYSLFDLPHLEKLELRLFTYSIDWLERLEHHSKTFIDLMLQTDSGTLESISVLEDVFPTSEQALWALGEIVQWNPYLQSSISELDLTGTHMLELPKGITYLHNLSHLNLSNNHLGKLPEWLMDLPLLKVLIVSDNPISVLPTFFEEMTHLEEIHLDGTQIDIENRLWLEALMSHCDLYF